MFQGEPMTTVQCHVVGRLCVVDAVRYGNELSHSVGQVGDALTFCSQNAVQSGQASLPCRRATPVALPLMSRRSYRARRQI